MTTQIAFNQMTVSWISNSGYKFNSILKTKYIGKTFSVISSRVNVSCKARVFWPTKVTGGLRHHNF